MLLYHPRPLLKGTSRRRRRSASARRQEKESPLCKVFFGHVSSLLRPNPQWFSQSPSIGKAPSEPNVPSPLVRIAGTREELSREEKTLARRGEGEGEVMGGGGNCRCSLFLLLSFLVWGVLRKSELVKHTITWRDGPDLVVAVVRGSSVWNMFLLSSFEWMQSHPTFDQVIANPLFPD